MKPKICVIGGGAWGQNHIRTLDEMGNLGAIVEANSERLKKLTEQYGVKGFLSVDDAMKSKFDGYIVSTPAKTHFSIGKKLLENGFNVLVEKPLALSSWESEQLVGIAKEKNSSLMVGHLLLFHQAIRKIRELVMNGKIGKLHYIYSTRLNFGTVRTEENVFWSFAPHDISVIDSIVGKPCTGISAKGLAVLQQNIEDIVIAQLSYPDDVQAHIFVSWLNPFKEQRMVIIGSKGMLSFDDSSKDKKICFYKKWIEWKEGAPIKVEEPDETIEYEFTAPLRSELEYFIENLNGEIGIADGRSGHEVVKILEEVDVELKK